MEKANWVKIRFGEKLQIGLGMCITITWVNNSYTEGDYQIDFLGLSTFCNFNNLDEAKKCAIRTSKLILKEAINNLEGIEE